PPPQALFDRCGGGLAEREVHFHAVGDVQDVAERDVNGASLVYTEGVLESCDASSEAWPYAVRQNCGSDFERRKARRSTRAHLQDQPIDAAHFAVVAIHHRLIEDIANQVHSASQELEWNDDQGQDSAQDGE